MMYREIIDEGETYLNTILEKIKTIITNFYIFPLRRSTRIPRKRCIGFRINQILCISLKMIT